MKLRYFLKKLRVPFLTTTKTIGVVQLWEVRWTSRSGEFHSDTRPEVEAFANEQDAEGFKLALEQAFALMRNSGPETSVTIKKAESA